MPITLTLRNLRPPTWAELTLADAARCLGGLPQDAFPVHSSDGMPSVLRRVIKMAQHMGRPSSAWRDERGRHWLFVGELVQRHGLVVLSVDQYGEEGQVIDTSRWQQNSAGQWQLGSAG